MNGILNVLKPPGMTSFDVIAYLRGIVKIRKMGHTGTLDPGAAGVLPVCIGKATRAIEFLAGQSKEYRAEMVLGISTDTQDSTGKIVFAKDVGDVNTEEIIKTIKSFEGVYMQVPPMYSAVKINGRRLYELAREGITTERKPRETVIYSINVVSMGPTAYKANGRVYDSYRVLFDVTCSKGTYIRTLCADIGEKLGLGGHMSFLVRTRAGPFNIFSAFPLEDIKTMYENGSLEQHIMAIGDALIDLKALVVSPSEEKRLLTGVPVIVDKSEGFSAGELVRVYDKNKVFVGVAEIKSMNGRFTAKLRKLFKS